MKLYYRLSETTDPEERLEDAALWKAIHDTFADEITLLPSDAKVPDDGYLLGRGKRNEVIHPPKLIINENMPYWTDNAFLSNCRRMFKVMTWNDAIEEVGRLHRDGRGAFLKATDTKSMVAKLPVGCDVFEETGAWAYSFIDRPPCVMVQELVDMKYERRFVVIDRQIVTQSPIAVHLTPLDYSVINLHYGTPLALTKPVRAPGLTQEMTDFVEGIAKTMKPDHAIIDVALINGEIGIVEFNAARIGQFGLYACDPYGIARAVKGLIVKMGEVAA